MIGVGRLLRREQTYPERVLWQHLRSRRFHGLKFRRQYPKGRFVLDFYCAEFRVGIEIDGALHGDVAQIEYDLRRENLLNAQGIRVIRVAAIDVLTNLGGVLKYLESQLPPPSPPTPLP